MRKAHAAGFGLVMMMAMGMTAMAQNAGGPNYQELFQQLDANGDFVIERGEVPDSGRASFEKLLKNGDANKDGKIDREEYRDMLLSLRNAFGSLSSRFTEIDKNGDGKLSKAEFIGPEPVFARIDVNGDDFISREEADKFQAGQGAGAGSGLAMFVQRLKDMDKNGDGKVSRDEFTGQPGVFDRLDADKDGFVTQKEIPGNAAGGAPAPDRAMMTQRFKAMDKDGDGKVSKDEFMGPTQLFERLDSNSDGFVSPDEMRPTRPEPGKAKGKAARP